jgi:hypothetical protein
MLATAFEEFRKASESSLQAQHDLFRQWGQQWLSSISSATASDWGKAAQKRWAELAVEALKKQRQALDSLYQSSIDLVEGSARVAEVKSPQDLGQMAEDFWRRSFDTLKGQSETQFREFQSWLEKSFEMTRTSNGSPASEALPRS